MSSVLYSVDAEQVVLGSLMHDPRLIGEPVISELADSDFYFQGHQAIFRAIQRLEGKSRECDAESIWTELTAAGDTEHVEDLGAVQNLHLWGKPRTAAHHAEVVAGCARLRNVQKRLCEALAITEEAGAVPAKLDRIAGLLAGLDESNSQRRPKTMGELMIQAMDRLNAASEGKLPTGWATGIPSLDRLFGGGLSPGKLVILAARPSIGKSSFSMHLAAQIAKGSRPCLVISQEMEDHELADRALANAARVRSDAIRSGKLTDDEWGRVAEGVDELGNSPISISDEPGQSLRSMNAKARAVKGLRLLVVDYVQLCEGEGDTRSAAVGSITRGLKKLAKQLNCCVIALSQLNRAVDSRGDKRPVMSDLRDSGEIEQDADSILFMWTLEEGDINQVGLDVAKNRGGKKGTMVLNFQGDIQHWSESTKRVDDFQVSKKSQGSWE